DGGKLVANDPPSAKVPAGGGPRHIAFHPTKNVVYTNNELSSAVTVFALDPEKGSMTELQTIKTTPADFSGSNDTAEILVSGDGRFVYVSNRGHNSIATFSIDGDKGMLTLVEHTSTQGNWPRDFKFDPSGKFLLVAHQKSNDVVVFNVDKGTGKLTASGNTLSMSKPVNFAFVPASGK
ncbi:MAG TPA: beta-propeller fold lactonase family protein, partial [Polyangia bacterium]